MTFKEAIDYFRKKDDSKWLTPLLMQPHLRALALAWEATRAASLVADPESIVIHPMIEDRDTWDSMWRNSVHEIDQMKLSDASALSPAQVRQGIEVLKANRLIYPDGTISKWCNDFLRLSVAQTLTAMAPPQPKGGPNAAK